MNAFSTAKMAYSAAQPHMRTDRGTEYEVFARVTSGLKAAAGGNFTDLAEALEQNRRLWALLATSVADDENKLPQQLRAQIFYLAEFTLQHSRKVLDKTASHDILVEINMMMMKGLRGQVEAA